MKSRLLQRKCEPQIKLTDLETITPQMLVVVILGHLGRSHFLNVWPINKDLINGLYANNNQSID